MSETKAAPERADATHFFNEAPFSVDLRNPKGDLLHLRGATIEEFVEAINAIWNGGQGDREEPTNILLFSFNPAIQASMMRGDTAEEAMGVETLSDYAKDVYDGIAQATKRQPAGSPSAGGGGGGGGGEQKTFLAPEIGDRLPEWFRDKLTRYDTCPACQDKKGEFYDNRGNTKNLPTFKCANADCKGSKNGQYAWGIYEPDSDDRSRRNSRTR